MSETLPAPDPSTKQQLPEPQPTTGPKMPPIDVNQLIKTAMQVVTNPAGFFETVREEKGFEKPLIFAVAMGLVSGALGLVIGILHLEAIFGWFPGWGNVIARIIIMPIAAAIGMFVGGGIIHVLVLILGGKPNYEVSARIAGYSAVVMPISAVAMWIPVLGMLVVLYGLYIAAMGMIALHQTERQKTFIVVGILAALGAIGSITSYLAARSAANALNSDAQQFSKDMEKAAKAWGDVAKKAAGGN